MLISLTSKASARDFNNFNNKDIFPRHTGFIKIVATSLYTSPFLASAYSPRRMMQLTGISITASTQCPYIGGDYYFQRAAYAASVRREAPPMPTIAGNARMPVDFATRARMSARLLFCSLDDILSAGTYRHFGSTESHAWRCRGFRHL